MEAALRVLDRDGLDTMSMRRVAEELGTGAASLYWHFGNKGELLDAVFDRVIGEINPRLRGWVNYFRIGHASRGFAFVRVWVERSIRRHLMRARNRRGFGWKRWSTAWLHTTLGLFGDYRVRYLVRA